MTSLWKSDRHPPESDVPLEPGTHHDVVIVGAGITGLVTGLRLAREGRDVAILESGGIAQLASGANTGKVSLLQGSVLSTLRRHHPASLVRAYVDANRAGMEWLRAFADEAGVPTTTQTAYSYAQGRAGLHVVDAEVAAAREAGLPVRRVDPADIPARPFPLAGAAALEGQLAIDPVRLADALARAFVAAGGVLHTGVRVRRVRVLPRPRVFTDAVEVAAGRIVLATGTPIDDRGLYFAKTQGLRSYCVAFETDAEIPPGMFLSIDEPSRSVRAVSAADGPAGPARLIVGGNGHPVGRAESERALIEDLVAWTREHFPDARETHRWWAQDYESHNLVPFVGGMPRSLGRVRFATGYGKWGLTNGPAAALRLADDIRGTRWRDRPRFTQRLSTRLTVPSDIARGLAENARVGRAALTRWAGAQTHAVPVVRPREGEGVVANRAGMPVAISTVNGHTRAVGAICPHLGGVLEWNDAACTWDCPLHASRFTAEGVRIEGPATSDLKPIR
jgi:glycine/D-amino acid oxidase-like deaminating enzyme/nitrite reductase/ring-hydroxylating ferredoxin subunit